MSSLLHRLRRWLQPPEPIGGEPVPAADTGPDAAPARAWVDALQEALASGDETAARARLEACIAEGHAREAADALAGDDVPGWQALLHAEALLAADLVAGRAALHGIVRARPELAAAAHARLAEHHREAGEAREALASYERALAHDLDRPRALALARELRARLTPPEAGAHEATVRLSRDRLGPAAARYGILREIGRGGAGTVYLAEDTRLARRVAIKALHPPRAHDRTSVARALDEARVAASLGHPGILRIYDLYPEARLIVMEYLAGGSLRERLGAGALPVVWVSRLFASLCTTLAVVHRRGLVHGDLKPANVLFRAHGPQPVLADFGVAAARGAGFAGAGTLTYMAPEVRGGEAGGPRSDLYSLGVLLYEALAGAPPFTRAALLRGATPRPPPLPPAVPPSLAEIVAALLEPDPAARPPTAEALVGMVLAMIPDEPGSNP